MMLKISVPVQSAPLLAYAQSKKENIFKSRDLRLLGFYIQRERGIRLTFDHIQLIHPPIGNSRNVRVDPRYRRKTLPLQQTAKAIDIMHVTMHFAGLSETAYPFCSGLGPVGN